MNNCILTSSSSLVLGNFPSHFVNNLQILQTGQVLVSDFYRTSMKIYRKQPFKADLKKGVVKILTKSLKNTCEGFHFLEKLYPRSLQIHRNSSKFLQRFNKFVMVFKNS